MDRASDVLSQHYKLLGPGLGIIHRRGKGVVDLDGTRRRYRRQRRRRRLAGSAREEELVKLKVLSRPSSSQSSSTSLSFPMSSAPPQRATLLSRTSVAPLPASTFNETDKIEPNLQRRQLAAMRIDSHRETFGGDLWSASAQQAPVTVANHQTSPWGSSSDGTVLGTTSTSGSRNRGSNTLSQSFRETDSSPWLGSLNRGHGAPPDLPGPPVFTAGGFSSGSVSSSSSSSGRRNRHHRSFSKSGNTLKGDLFATEPGLHGELSAHAAAARAHRRRDAAHERHVFQEVYGLPTLLCPRLANFTFLLGYASSLPAAEGRCTWQSP